MNNLAALYNSQEKYTEAEPLYKKSLMIKRKTLGNEHPEVSELMDKLGKLYKAQSKYVEAESIYKQSLKINKEETWE